MVLNIIKTLVYCWRTYLMQYIVVQCVMCMTERNKLNLIGIYIRKIYAWQYYFNFRHSQRYMLSVRSLIAINT